jgi:hypothetical protein
MHPGLRLGGPAGSPDASESGYFAVRGMLAKSVSEAARFVAERGLIEEGAPIVVRFISQVASRFGVVLTQKFAAQALPLVGALGGASVNYLFIEHFQETAQGHFTVRRLERAYGKDIVRTEYASCTEALRSIRRAELKENQTALTSANDLAIRRALESAGVEFIDENGGGPGVRLRKREQKKGSRRE